MLHGRQILGRINRVGALHGINQHAGSVIGIGGVQHDTGTGLGLQLFLKRGVARQLVARSARLAGVLAFTGITGKLEEHRRIEAVAAEELGLDAEFLHLAGHRSGLGVHAAVVDGIRVGGLDGRQDGGKVRGLVIGEFAFDDFGTGSLGGFFEFVSHALAIGRAVVDHGNLLDALLVDHEFGHGLTLLHVIGNHAEDVFVTLRSHLRAGGRRRDLRDAGFGVDLRCGDGRTRGQVAHQADNLVVDKALGNLGSGFRIAGIVGADQFELDLLAADDQTFCIGFIQGDGHPVICILAHMGNRARQRCGMTDLDHYFTRLGSGGLGRCGFFLAACSQGEGHGRN